MKLVLLVCYILTVALVGLSCVDWHLPYLPYVPDPDDVEILAVTSEAETTVQVTLQLRTLCERVCGWGRMRRRGNEFSVNARITAYTGFCADMLPPPDTHEYELGRLADGDYEFTFMVWGKAVKTVEFTLNRNDEPAIADTAHLLTRSLLIVIQ